MDNTTLAPNGTTTFKQTLFPIPVVILLGIIAGIGVVGNILIISSVSLSKRLRVRGNAFIVNLAVADLIITAFVMPMGLVQSRFEFRIIEGFLCEINAFFILLCLGVSTQSLMMIAIERYVHICHMHSYGKIFSTTLVGVYIALTWLYTAAWTCQGWTGWTKYVYNRLSYVCLFSARSISYDVCIAFFGMILPMIILGFCYYKIFRTVQQSSVALSSHDKQESGKINNGSSVESPSKILSRRKNAKERKVIIMLFTIVIIFVVCWLPAAITLTIAPLVRGVPWGFYTLGVWLAFCNSSINGVIYGTMNTNFRRAYIHFLTCAYCNCGEEGENCRCPPTFGSTTDESSGTKNKPPLQNTQNTQNTSIATEDFRSKSDSVSLVEKPAKLKQRNSDMNDINLIENDDRGIKKKDVNKRVDFKDNAMNSTPKSNLPAGQIMFEANM